MNWIKFAETTFYVALSGALGAAVIGVVVPELFQEWNKLGLIMLFGAIKDVRLLLTNVSFQKRIGVDLDKE